MKKTIVLFLTTILVVTISCACGGSGSQTAEGTTITNSTEESITEAVVTETSTEIETEPETMASIPVSLGEKIETDNFSMTFDSFEILPEFSYKTSENSSTSLYVEDGYQLAMFRGHFANNGSSVIQDSSFAFTFTVNESFVKDGFDVKLNFLRNKYFEIDPYTDFDYVLYINIPNKLVEQFESAVVSIGFKNDMSVISTIYNADGTKTVEVDNMYVVSSGNNISASQSSSSEETTTAAAASNQSPALAIGDTISTDGFDFALSGVEFTYELLPQNTSSVYMSYTPESGKVYLHIDGYYYNKSKTNICIRDLPVATVDYDNGYQYKGFALVDKDDNSFTWVSSYVICEPLSTCHYHCLVEVPDIVASSEAPLFFTMKLGDTDYRCDIR